MTSDFSDFKNTYRQEVQASISFIGQDVDFFTEVKAKHILELARQHFGELKDLKVLDVGCGVGETDRYLTKRFGELYGVDVAAGVLDVAGTKNPTAKYLVYDGSTLPFQDDMFDVAFAVCVLHHVEPRKWSRFISEMKRVTREGGLVAVFEHNPFNPLTKLAVNRCAFDKDATLVSARRLSNILINSGMVIIDRNYFLFFPSRGHIFSIIERWLWRFPLGAQYYIVAGKSLTD